jgi:hypothetical protein
MDQMQRNIRENNGQVCYGPPKIEEKRIDYDGNKRLEKAREGTPCQQNHI